MRIFELADNSHSRNFSNGLPKSRNLRISTAESWANLDEFVGRLTHSGCRITNLFYSLSWSGRKDYTYQSIICYHPLFNCLDNKVQTTEELTRFAVAIANENIERDKKREAERIEKEQKQSRRREAYRRSKLKRAITAESHAVH